METMKKRIMVIAEAGVNHNGSIDIAKKLVDAAVSAGADFIKFQTFKADLIVTEKAEKADYQKLNTSNSGSQHSMLKALELNYQHHKLLHEYCEGKIGFLSTAFDKESLEFLMNLGIKYIKIPSGEANNLPYLRQIGRLNVPTLLSTGMCDLNDIELAIDIMVTAGLDRNKLIILHCTTIYPAQPRDVNLRAMNTIAQKFDLRVGYSDHTLGIDIPIAAATLGACFIEKHLTLDRMMIGPDHAASLEPTEFSAMVESIRRIELALGDGIKQPVGDENKNKLIARRSIVAIANINAGEFFTEKNISTKRPGTGMSPLLWDEVIGLKAHRDFKIDDFIEI